MTTEMQLCPPFMGELMTCVLCSNTHRSTAGVSTDWRCIIVNDLFFYICPNEFPRFGASIELYKEVYTRALKVIITIINGQNHST